MSVTRRLINLYPDDALRPTPSKTEKGREPVMPISSDTEEDTQGMLLALCVIAYNVAVSIETT